METDEAQCSFELKYAIVNTVLYFTCGIVAVYALAQHKPRKLPLYVGSSVVFNTWGRRFICARCDNYGKACSSLFGITTSKMMRRDECKSLTRNAILVEDVILYCIVLIPLPQILQSRWLTILYASGVIASSMGFFKYGCPNCGNDFCPHKDISKALLRRPG